MTTKQQPIGSGLGARTTAEEALGGRDLSGKVAMVTGGYSGLGLETTRVLAEAGATVIVPVRSHEKAQRNLEGIPRVETASLDLLEPASIDAFATAFLASGRPLDILVASAGIMAAPLFRDDRGYEAQFATNHLGHFQLAARLWPALRQANGARVVSVSSLGHRLAGIDFDDPNFERRAYDKWLAYGQSMTAKILFALALDQRGRSQGVRAFSLHPGSIITDLNRHLTDEELGAFGVKRGTDGRFLVDEFLSTVPGAKTIPQGAATIVWCAANSQLDGKGGVYCEDCDIAVVSPERLLVPGVHPSAIDPETADRLWSLSERLTGVPFKI
jgi:NAD(P)-dependent dehydrogenase (short-subunit alcohol dehydrogenase family)